MVGDGDADEDGLYVFAGLADIQQRERRIRTAQDYTGTAPASPVISGHIQTAGGMAIAGVVMSGLAGSPQTNASGDYTGSVIYGWTGTVTPTKAGYTFSPVSRSYSNVTSNQTAQNYAGTPPPSILIIDMDGNHNSGPAMTTAAQANGYLTTI